MRDAVKPIFTRFQAQFEGKLPCMYLDQHLNAQGQLSPLVTTAIGLLIDPMQKALSLPWKLADLTTPATPEQITHEWNVVKSKTTMAIYGGHAFMTITSLRLTDQDIEAVTLRVADAFEIVLKQRFAEWEELPADAQLGLFSLAWPEGPGFYQRFPKLSAAVDRWDFDVAADESSIPGSYMLRNRATKTCFANAAAVMRVPSLYSPDILYWPHDIAGTTGA